jgi:transposase InsO family protein
MGAKVIYKKLTPCFMGRDRFIEFYKEEGLTLFKTKNFRRTTDSMGVIRFPNLLSGLELTSVNQVLVSDITYFDLHGKFVYITFIMDLYSRKIKGYSLGRTLRTEDTTLPALKLAMREVPKNSNTIIHSDGGGQYYSKEFLSITKDRFTSSMAESVYENAHAERVNGTIKNDYLIPANPKDFHHLNRLLAQAVEKYNNHRPHQSLRYLTPTEFERNAPSYPQNRTFLTKEKRSKKENNYNYTRIN